MNRLIKRSMHITKLKKGYNTANSSKNRRMQGKRLKIGVSVFQFTEKFFKEIKTAQLNIRFSYSIKMWDCSVEALTTAQFHVRS